MTEFLAALAGSVAGGLLALVGSYLASRWQAKHQRSNLLHEARIALYVDLIADCREREAWLDALCESYADVERLGKGYRPTVPVDARVELLALDGTRSAWALLMDAHERLGVTMENKCFPSNALDWLSPRLPELREVRDRVEGLRAAVHRDLTKG